ncbi:MAG: hypothetical protein LBC43_05185 [Bifidobacteriaceae bacterium]|jgi:hypothetical protein|nr:hypothetical protein [Bifidobacteriaceae bacterium]
MKSFSIRRPWTFVIFGIILVGFIATQIPAAYASQWNFFGSDDIWFGRFTHAAWVDTHNIFSVLNAAFYTAAHVWQNWQGNFTAVVMFALNPAVFDEDGMHNWAGPWVVIGFLLAGTIILTKVILSNYLKATWEVSLSVGFLLGIIFTQLVPSYRSAFLWWAAAVNYGVFLGLIFMMIACFLKYFRAKGWKKGLYYGLGAFLACFVAGGMYVFHTFLLVGFLGTLAIKEQVYKNKKGRLLYLIFIPFAILSMINILAPGNLNRMASVEASAIRNPFLAIFESYAYAIKETIWAASTGSGEAQAPPNGVNFAYLAMVVLVAILCWAVVKRVNFKFRMPGLITVLSVTAYASYYTPFIYAQGIDVRPRVFDCGYYIWWMVMILNFIWWMGWLKPRLVRYHKQHKKFFSQRFFGNSYSLAQGVAVPVLLIAFCLGYFNMTNYVNGYLGVRPGALANYDAVTQEYVASGQAPNQDGTMTQGLVHFGRTLPEVNMDYINQFKADLAKSDGSVTLPDTRENDKLLTAHLDMCPEPGYGYNSYAETYWNKEHVQAYYPNETTVSWWMNPQTDEEYYQQKVNSCAGQEHLNA